MDKELWHSWWSRATEYTDYESTAGFAPEFIVYLMRGKIA